jgi:hypothetical protein
MIRLRILYATVLMLATFAACPTTTSSGLNADDLVAQIKEIAGDIETGPNAVKFTYGGRTMLCVYDETHDRMRLVAPVVDGATLGPRQLEIMLTANYYTTLDAR